MHAAGGEQSEPAAGPLLQAAPRADPRRSGVLRLVGRGTGDPGHRGQVASPTLVSHLDFGARRQRRHAHGLARCPGRDVLVVTDECVHNDCEGIPKQVRMVDIADETQPEGGQPVPGAGGGRLLRSRGGRFGPHNVHEMRPGTLSDPNTVLPDLLQRRRARAGRRRTPPPRARSPTSCRRRRRAARASS